MKLSKEDLQEIAEVIYNRDWESQEEFQDYIDGFLHEVSEKQAAAQLIENGKAEIAKGKTKALNDFMGEL